MKYLLSLMVLLNCVNFFHNTVNAQSTCKPCNTPSGRYLVDVFSVEEVIRTSDIFYADSLSKNPRALNFYSVKDSCVSRPLIVYLPGSGFIDRGANPKNSDVANAKALYFAQKGYAVAVVDYYRVADPYTSGSKFNGVMHEAMKDVHAAIQYLIGYHKTFRVDTSNIFIIGESAGGIAGLGAILSDVNGEFIAEEIPSYVSPEDISLNHESLFPNRKVFIKGFAGISTSAPTAAFFQLRARNVNIPLLFIHSNGDKIVPFDSTTSDLFEGALIQPLCGPKCMLDIKIRDKGSNCFQLNEVEDTTHDVLSRPVGIQYLVEMRNFFYEQVNCYDCESYHNKYLPDVTDSLGAEFPIEELSNVVIYPNPAQSHIIIKGLVPLELSRIIIYNIAGKIIGDYETTNAVKWLDLSNYETGLYVVKVSTDEKTVIQKFSKN
ncbi:T9SS type A sorting domain-containing protein [Acidiluteibacter ferrifornacis]|uniref:T9SS type A sorting domain-containing protein n=1 Tax=Acidiluteibacter ferrifornacis TaxID=2692424 RepID=A0A6N9NK55_9FLAO|nr:T9SS type A sorting domain-containing protein [Acidiluteibacter ferrifornacis]NBG67078.1 T9SS type A sorting domain-containing protein [Acidiluteibacter ferrifornacis]